jgi:hypothetical protein
MKKGITHRLLAKYLKKEILSPSPLRLRGETKTHRPFASLPQVAKYAKKEIDILSLSPSPLRLCGVISKTHRPFASLSQDAKYANKVEETKFIKFLCPPLRLRSVISMTHRTSAVYAMNA